ncbi:hypothetical protein ACFQI7_08815 [Paenibacillus allorhizosphaerae]|uniref:Uncharacterized protein n=1 Tax=Paenibacillus allorhizosphaerae TaxID=2849866 RepID=A0ABM8VI77_9BACL|nr:hypothetical protein [Paenibacillus allorhizosphaerae]CAG7643787.1 hypothetical protein PAECIP111802_03074 [Paenibacillus allorhizosphaerae]
MIVAYLGLVGMLLFYAILFIVVLSIIRKKLGVKPAIIFLVLMLFAAFVYSIWNHNWLLAASTVILSISIKKGLYSKLM